ncbi:BRCA1-associated RING domain protein 1 [Pygocentrus nattereri]|uniref:BRCT domain-containing protein n=1 Tax=Pygocentrus nattereri TaxID=42514 RepID=A0A3B4C958_PYGNA|nr:BRCA1-associated RING domain protein 1 [Pygocentrus nattereri]
MGDLLDPPAESENGAWEKTREAVANFRKLLLCSKCSNILTEPVCLGICEHLLCRSCAGPHAGDGCSVCHSPAWVKDIQINRQLSNITELFCNLESLLYPSEVQAPSADSSTPSNETSVLKQKKNFKIWFSPKSRKVRCRVEKPVEVNLQTGKTGPSEPTSKLQDTKLLSVFNFNSSSQDSGSSSSPRNGGHHGRKTKRKKRSVGYAGKQASNISRPPTRYQTKQKLKTMRLEAVNQQWGFGKDGALEGEVQEKEEKNCDDSEGKISKRVSFQCPDSLLKPQEIQEASPQGAPSSKKILKDGTVKEIELSSEEQKSPAQNMQSVCEQQPNPVIETEPAVNTKRPARPSPAKSPKRARPKEQGGSPQTTPKRPRLSPLRRGRSAPGRLAPLPTPSLSPESSRLSNVCERARQEEAQGSPNCSPSSGRRAPSERHSQSSPAYMKRNHKGETPLHLAAIKGDVEATKELLAQGADPNLKDNAGWTPLHEACNLGHLGVVEVLLQQGALLNTPGYENDSPLHDAVRNGHVAVARLLLKHGASPSVLNILGLRPVDYAVTQEMKEVLRAGTEATHSTTTPLTSPASLSKSPGIIRRDVPVTLIGSKLTQLQQNQLIKATRILGGRRVETFSSAVTHVVVPDGPVPATLTALQGILSGCWVVSFRWLADCLQQGRWLEESEFAAGEGPRRARVNGDNLLPRLFDGCFFYLLGSFQKPPKEELLQLVKAGGGQLLSRQPKPDSDVTQTLNSAAYHAQPSSDQAFCTQYILYDPEGSYRPSRVRLGKVWSAPSSWLLDCIKAFSLLPVPEV